MDPYGSLSKHGPNLGDFGHLSCELTPLLPMSHRSDGLEWSHCAESSDKKFGEYIGFLIRYHQPLWGSLWTNQYTGMSNNGFVSELPMFFFQKHVVNSREMWWTTWMCQVGFYYSSNDIDSIEVLLPSPTVTDAVTWCVLFLCYFRPCSKILGKIHSSLSHLSMFFQMALHPNNKTNVQYDWNRHTDQTLPSIFHLWYIYQYFGRFWWSIYDDICKYTIHGCYGVVSLVMYVSAFVHPGWLVLCTIYNPVVYTLPETSIISTLKIDGWKMILSFWDGLFSGCELFVFVGVMWLSKVVSTHLWITPLNLYQQAIIRDSFHTWRTGDCLGCAPGTSTNQDFMLHVTSGGILWHASEAF